MIEQRQVKVRQIDDGILYHYTKSNGINGIVHSNCFWATKSDFLNDPKEFSYIENIVDSVCQETIEDDSLRDMFLNDVLEENILMSGEKNREYFVLSYSNCRDSITMWSEFGNHTGYNIGLYSTEIIKRIEEKNKIAYHGFVVYSPLEQKEIVKRIISETIPKEMKMTFDDIVRDGANNRGSAIYKKTCKLFQRMTAVYAMFFKNEAFREEQEYRFVFMKRKETEVFFREKDGFMIPYIKIQLSDELLPVTEIVVAPQNHIDLAQKGMKYMMEEKGYNVNVSLSNIKLRY